MAFGMKSFACDLDSFVAPITSGEALSADQSKLMRFFGEPKPGIALAQLKPVFGPTGQHSIGLAASSRGQIIDKTPM
jgi:hypothetical protein